MRFIYIILLLFIFSSVYAQKDLTLIYIDPSNSDDKISSIIETVSEITQQSYKNPIDSKVLLFISNGQFPIITTEFSEINDKLQRLYEIMINNVDYINDINSINNQIIQNKFIVDLNNINDEVALYYSMKIHLFLEEDNYKLMDLKSKFIDPFLFSNNLKSGNSLHDNCQLWLYQDKVNSENINKLSYDEL